MAEYNTPRTDRPLVSSKTKGNYTFTTKGNYTTKGGDTPTDS